MRPVHEFINNFIATEPASEKPNANSSDDGAPLNRFKTDDTIRNVCFVWPNGRRTFFNYGYLVTGIFEPNGGKNMIELQFSSQTVTLSGYCLEPLFTDFITHRPRIITAIEMRYALPPHSERPYVNTITVESKEI